MENKRKLDAIAIITILDDDDVIGSCKCSVCGCNIDLKDAYCRKCGSYIKEHKINHAEKINYSDEYYGVM